MDSPVEKPEVIRLTLYGDPVGKARPRVTRSRTGKSLTYTPAKTAWAQDMWRVIFLDSRQESVPKGIPLSLTLRAYLKRPKRLGQGVRWPITRPDLDNLAKLVLDALEGLAYHRDSAFVYMLLSKHYAITPELPRVEIEIREVDEEQPSLGSRDSNLIVTAPFIDYGWQGDKVPDKEAEYQPGTAGSPLVGWGIKASEWNSGASIRVI